MERRGLSQSELARRIGVSQQNIHRLVSGKAYGSRHLHKIARELGTSPAYLAGEIDDPEEGAPPPSPVPTMQLVPMAVALPSQPALADMFAALLRSVPAGSSRDETAQTLAELLPIGLGRLQAQLLRQVPVFVDTEPSLPEAAASGDPELQQAQRM